MLQGGQTGDIVMRHAIGIAVIAALIGTPALAADMAVKAAPPAPAAAPYSWTGFYVGANAGYGWGHENVSYSPNDPAAVVLFTGAGGFTNSSAPIPNSYNVSGAIGGFQLGYNWQFNRNWVAGLETDFDWSGVQGSGPGTTTLVTTGGNGPLSEPASEKIDWFGTVRARLDYLITDNLLTYATGGLAYGRIDRSASYANNSTLIGIGNETAGFSWNCNPSSVCFLGSSQSVDLGWAAGAGFEYAAWSNITVKVEYLYVGLNSKSVVETNTLPFPPGTIASSFSANYGTVGLNIIRAGVNYRF
jgi:outer membrane immunogenic protein